MLRIADSIIAVSHPVLALDVTTCGQTVPVGEIGVLVDDLACAPTDQLGVGLERGATLNLNGFKLSNGDNIGVRCRSHSCTISGPGSIEGSDRIAVSLADNVRLSISDVTISGAGVGILGSATQRHSTKVDLKNVRIENSLGWALSARKIRADGLTVTGTGSGAYAVYAVKVIGAGIDISNNGTMGLQTRSVRATNLTVNGNTGIGVDTRRAVLFESILMGNAATGSGVDLRSSRRPRLIDTTCGKSGDDSGGDWSVCTNDPPA